MEYNYNGRINILIEPTTPDGSLIVAIHGGGGTPSDLQAKSNLEATFTNSYIIYASSDTTLTWKSGNKLDDVSYLHSLIHELANNFPLIDLAKVHLLGHSNGGMMCYKLAAVLDEFGFASVSIISGCYVASNTFDYSGKVFHFHVANDQTIPIDGSVPGFTGINYTISKVNEIHRNAVFRIESSASLSDTDAHTLNLILDAFPDLLIEIKSYIGL